MRTSLFFFHIAQVRPFGETFVSWCSERKQCTLGCLLV